MVYIIYVLVAIGVFLNLSKIKNDKGLNISPVLIFFYSVFWPLGLCKVISIFSTKDHSFWDKDNG